MDIKSLEFHPRFFILALLFVDTASHFPFNDGRHIILNPSLLMWDEALSACQDMNGTLLTIYDLGTLVDLEIDGQWITWVGLKLTPDDDSSSARWSSGAPMSWSNWIEPRNSPLKVESCTTVMTFHPYSWKAKNCTTKLPSLCELKNGNIYYNLDNSVDFLVRWASRNCTCRFEVSRKTSLVGFNTAQEFGLDLDACRDKCQNNVLFTCLSFEYNSLRKFCLLSDTHRWNHEAHFANFDKEWDYYHRSCYTVYVDDDLTPNGETLPTSEGPSTVAYSTTEDPTEEGYVCVKAESLELTENKTKEIKKEVEELHVMSVKFKEKRRSQSKKSVVDPRPSARYVGTVAVAIVVSMLGAVIVLDVMTLGRHCSHFKDKDRDKTKTMVSMKRRSFSDFAAGRVVPPSWPSPDASNSNQDHYSSPTELDDVEVEIRIQEPESDNTTRSTCTVQPDIHSTIRSIGQLKVEKDSTISSISQLKVDKDSTNSNDQQMAVNSYVSWPYSTKSSPILFPFYRSRSEKTNGFRKSPSISLSRRNRQARSQSDSFFNKRIHVMPEAHKHWTGRRVDFTSKREQLVMAYGHHFESDDNDKNSSATYRGHLKKNGTNTSMPISDTAVPPLNAEKLRRGSQC